MQIGYARVSTKEQSFDLQVDALRKTGFTQAHRKLLISLLYMHGYIRLTH